MILHLHTDSRFADYTINLFKEGSFHLVGMRYPSQKLRFINSHENVHRYVFGWSSPQKVIARLKPKMVIVHFMDLRWFEVLSRLESDTAVIWIFWGGDGYSLPELKSELYDPLTSKSLTQNSVKVSRFEKLKADLGVKSFLSFAFVSSLFFEVLRKRRSRLSTLDQQLSLFQRVHYCGTFLKEDYELLQSKYHFKMKWMDARFISLEKLVGSLNLSQSAGKNVLFGNSCTIENNHLDGIKSMKHLAFDSDQDILCPLSYGKDIGYYRSYVIQSGKETLGSHFRPLVDLMPLEEYTKLLKSCGFAIMYHNRQQAFNNILALIVLGVKVYLKPQNTIYQFLKRIGCHVFSTDELPLISKLEQLEAGKIEENREILMREFSQERIVESAKRMADLAKDKDVEIGS